MSAPKLRVGPYVAGTFRFGHFPIRLFVAAHRGRWTAMLTTTRSGGISTSLHPSGKPSRHKTWRVPRNRRDHNPYMSSSRTRRSHHP